MKNNNQKGITLIALIITIIVLLILAGVTISLTLGEGGIFKIATNAVEETKEKSAIEKVQLMLADYMTEKYIGTKTLEEYLNEQKAKGELDEVTNNGDGTITVEVDGYEITIREDDLKIIETVKVGGVKPTFEVYITTPTGNTIEPSEEETLEQKAITINIKNIAEFGENFTIQVKNSNGTALTKETNVISGITGQASYIINKTGIYIITVTGTKEGKTKTATKTEEIEVAILPIEESAMFSKEYGVIDIVWLDTNNNVIPDPMSPKDYLGGLTAVKYNESESEWVPADVDNESNDWYNYLPQVGTTDGKTSNWANARTSDSDAYFVWIPRYAYKITYFDSPENADLYRANKNSAKGIVGYSNREGIIKIENGEEKPLKDSTPVNVTGEVQTAGYKDYIPHPAFQFGSGTTGVKAGIWVGKFEASGAANTAISEGAVKIVPNKTSLKSIKVGNILTACEKVKEKYNLTSDSHMMKNTEWGVVAYLAESKYGRNGTEIEMNNRNDLTGQGDYVEYTNKTTTGNISGIYDINGTSWEYIAGILDSMKKKRNRL